MSSSTVSCGGARTSVDCVDAEHAHDNTGAQQQADEGGFGEDSEKVVRGDPEPMESSRRLRVICSIPLRSRGSWRWSWRWRSWRSRRTWVHSGSYWIKGLHLGIKASMAKPGPQRVRKVERSKRKAVVRKESADCQEYAPYKRQGRGRGPARGRAARAKGHGLRRE